jgi:hypothetical protein
MLSLASEMIRDRRALSRRLSEGRQFLRFLRNHR